MHPCYQPVNYCCRVLLKTAIKLFYHREQIRMSFMRIVADWAAKHSKAFTHPCSWPPILHLGAWLPTSEPFQPPSPPPSMSPPTGSCRSHAPANSRHGGSFEQNLLPLRRRVEGNCPHPSFAWQRRDVATSGVHRSGARKEWDQNLISYLRDHFRTSFSFRTSF